MGYDNYLLSNMFLALDKFLVLDEDTSELPPLISVNSSDTISHVIQTFINNKIHRLYIVDGTTTKGVITISDILALC